MDGDCKKIQDKAGREYWDAQWSNFTIPEIIDPGNTKPGGVIGRAQDRFLRKYLKENYHSSKGGGGSRVLLEAGCANSFFLPYLNKELGFEVYGLDYSHAGCEGAKKVLEYYGADGTIILGDIFEPPSDMYGRFDVVISMGVIEHFSDTEKVCRALGKLVKPEGIIVTEVPNFSKGSICSGIQKIADRKVYDKHVPLSREDVLNAHERCGFQTVYCNYTIGMNFGVIHYKKSQEWIKKSLTRMSKLVMLMKKDKLRGTKMFSPYIYYVGEKVRNGF